MDLGYKAYCTVAPTERALKSTSCLTRKGRMCWTSWIYLHIARPKICLSILFPSFIPCETAVEWVSLWIIGWANFHPVIACVQLTTYLHHPKLLFLFGHFSDWRQSIFVLPIYLTGLQQNLKIAFTSCLTGHHIPVARLQCWDGISWVAEVPSSVRGRAEDLTTVQLLFEMHFEFHIQWQQHGN